MILEPLPPAYPYFGSKAKVAPLIWDAFGDVPNYVEPFAGSAAVHFARPHRGKLVTLNELHVITNFLRAIHSDPEAVARWAAWNVNEIDLHARHTWLVEKGPELERQLREDPAFFDAQTAGWWVWGQCVWVGGGWCSEDTVGYRRRPALAGRGKEHRLHHGNGIFRERLPHLIGPHNARKVGPMPQLQGSDGSGVGYGRGIFASGRREDLVGYFRALADRLDWPRVRITCGDWSRVVTPAVTISHGRTGILLDAPYGERANRSKKLYAKDSLAVIEAAYRWAIERGDHPLYLIAFCCYEGEFTFPDGWRCVGWASNGYDNQDGETTNSRREQIWFSRYCLGGQAIAGPLFERTARAEASHD